ncbi:DENN domain-containing protein [Colletotrichum tofieldiae]|uniref:DENN domain-containing protein n=2 Tax=Colletotrichum spaethianum species complex TaxID=2707349 RepID=A0A166RAD4_9PEZI|nr:DENN domain-containing protein [Colletotrichum tofieldiae]KZL87708.1 denn domain-containing protein [Colletotrichum incanum]OHW91943.1 DENN domain-containing protein [Colletotrichum incanum]GKT57207.1 DENN domain-containing protein [Colletotrichum tofieldiae]GKT78938.1 DENN domain-containing protein [Colletotrichum tofieldiae]
MAPSLNAHSSFTRPRTGDRDGRPTTRDQGDTNLIIPSRTSSLHSRITQPIPSTLNAKPQQRTPKTLTHAYMVCGVGREPSQWVKAPAPAQGKIGHMKGAVGQFWLPEILGSSPRLEQDNEIARSLHAAMRACFPHDVEICTGRSQPHCVHHAFVLQQDSSHTLYGICLRVWSRADEKRAETIRDLRKRTEPDYYDNPDETYWIPYCLSFLSRYPLYNLLGDYLRGMWIHWNKATNLFHAEEVSRILSFPAPRLNDLVRIDMKDYALCYQFPSSPTGFQNFAMWPLFCCLSIPNIVGVIEAAISPTRRIIFVSHYPAMLTMAAETVRYCVRVYEWSGLYVPVVHARHAKDLVQEPGPYILGITAECRSLFTAPTDALVVDLDRNFVLTSSPPTALNPSQRNKFVTRLTQSLNGDVTPSGVPPHLRSAYGGGKLVPAGQIIVMRGEVESIQDPEWWSQDSVMAVMDHVCEKMGRNTGIKAVFGGSVKKPLMTKVSMRHLNEIVRERNQYSRDALEAWQDFINLKGRMDTELNKVTKRNNYLNEELESWKQQFLKFQAFAEQLTKETQDLKAKIETHKRENRRLASLIDQQKDDNGRLNVRLGATEKQRDDALEALVLQQEIAEELERERKRNKKELAALQHTNVTILRQRDEARRVVLHLRSLIGGQSHHMEHLVQSLTKPDDLEREIEEGFEPEVGEDGVAPRDADANQARLLSAAAEANKRLSSSSFKDVADRHLKDKTDAIAHIIRNIAEQCQAAVEGLQLAQDADFDERAASAARLRAQRRRSNLSATHSDDGHETQSNATSDMGDDSLLHPASGRISSIPPTPDLVPNRSSTAMSFASSAATPERSSQQYMIHQDIPTKIVEDDEDFEEDRSESETMPQQSVGKHTDSLIHRPSGARISALGGTR